MDRVLPAVDALLKIIWRRSAATKFCCETVLLLMMPVPLIISSPSHGKVLHPTMDKLKEEESEVNTMLFTSSDVEMFTFVCED